MKTITGVEGSVEAEPAKTRVQLLSARPRPTPRHLVRLGGVLSGFLEVQLEHLACCGA